MIRSFISILLLNKNIFLFHASSFVKNNKAYLFAGQSGQGKSTIVTRAPLIDRLGDDTSVVSFNKGRIFIHTSPFDNLKMSKLIYKKSSSWFFFLLHHSNKDSIKKLGLLPSLNALIKNNYFYLYIYPRSAYRTIDDMKKME